ncbi:hypothetical protein L6452_35168 [Arctium lappa]|uniref:Uncharacterized protein n=1 Tax=Arctium lappa TaxID=4217 RepID=A0ACB8YJI1_ARCLA|nr:hypothetical protein L6452_35168 [Arctium lappa]
MPRHLISDAHEWINEIPTVPVYYPAKPQPRERAWQNQRERRPYELKREQKSRVEQKGKSSFDSDFHQWREATVRWIMTERLKSESGLEATRVPAACLPTSSRGLRPPKARVRWPSSCDGRVVRAALKYNSHQAAGRILCRRLKYATGYCKWQSGLAATIH